MALGSRTKRGSQRVLVADDSITVQKLVHITLAPSSYEVIAAADGPDALVKIRNLKPDVAFIACELPQVDGYKICETVRKDPALQSIKLVLLRTNAQKDAVSKGRAVGADEILLKPFDSSQLLRCLDIVKQKRSSSSPELSEREESTIVRRMDPEPREDSTTLSLKEMIDPAAAAASQKSGSDLNQRLEEIAASVASEKAQESDEAARETFRVEPAEFQHPVDEAALGREPTKESLGIKAEAELKAWIEKNLPAMAEKLLKEEIAKLLG